MLSRQARFTRHSSNESVIHDFISAAELYHFSRVCRVVISHSASPPKITSLSKHSKALWMNSSKRQEVDTIYTTKESHLRVGKISGSLARGVDIALSSTFWPIGQHLLWYLCGLPTRDDCLGERGGRPPSTLGLACVHSANHGRVTLLLAL
jgi:hypothetical protein